MADAWRGGLVTGPIAIADALLEWVRAEASAAPDGEVCGLLFGTDGRIEAARSTPNVADDPARGFEIDPAALIAAHRAERAGGPRLIGCYHSHPGGRPAPSARDAAAAEPGSLWLIVGVGASGGEARLWRATATGFAAVALDVGRSPHGRS